VREHLHHVELVLGAVLLEEALQVGSPRGGEEPLAAHPCADLMREAERRPAEIFVVRPRDLEGTLERVLHLTVEPLLYRVPEEDHGSEEHERGRQERDPHERDHEARPQVCTEHVLPSLEDELQDVPADQEDEDDEEDDVEVDERHQHRVGAEGSRTGGLREAGLEDREGHHREGGGEDDPALASATPRLG